MESSFTESRRGFTLIELLVVIGIIALLISILMPVLTKVRKQGEATKCASNLRQIGMALQMYANDNKGWVPLGSSLWKEMEESGHLKKMFLLVRANGYEDGIGLNNVTEGLLFRCPSLRIDGRAYSPVPPPRNWNYTVNTRTFGHTNPYFFNRRKLASVRQSSTRAWIADAPPADPCWETYDNGNMMISYNRHRQGSNVLYVDGHVGYVNPYTDLYWQTSSVFTTDLNFYGTNIN